MSAMSLIKILAHPPKGIVVLGLCCMVPLVMGGCTQFQTDVVGVLETATRSALLSTEDEWTIANAARVSLVDSTISLVFDQLLPDDY